MKILIPVLFALLGYLGLLRATEKVFNWQKKPARIHALALVVWFVLFGLVQAVLSGLLPVGGVNQFEIVFIILVVTLLNFLVLRLLYRETKTSTGIVAALQSLLFFLRGLHRCRMTTSILQLVALDETGDSSYRMRWPGRDLSIQTGWSVINLDAQASERFALAEQADLLILFQSQDLDLLPIIEKRRALGKRTLAEYNDNFYATSEWFPVHPLWSSPLVWQSYETIASQVDGVIVTGGALADELRARLPEQNFIPIPNYLPMSPKSFAECQSIKGDELLVGWGGSFGHLADFLSFYPLIQASIKKAKIGSFSCMGNAALPELCQLLRNDEQPIHPDRFVPWGSMNEYFSFLSTLHIGVIPLCDTAYNRCRSDIKAVEMAAHGVAPLVPALPPYREFISQTGCPHYSSPDEFMTAFNKLLVDPTYRRQVAEKALDYVVINRVGIHNRDREKIYRSFLQPQLDGQIEWHLPGGYIEEIGTTLAITRTGELLTHVDKLLQRNTNEPALDILESEEGRGSLQPDLLVRRIQIYLKEDREKAYLAATQAFLRFPRDLRFLIAMIHSAPAAEQEGEHLRALLIRLQECPQSRKFFQTLVLRLLVGMKSIDTELLEAFSELYPYAIELQVNFAERMRRKGMRDAALRYFTQAESALCVLEMNGYVPHSVDAPYIRMWVAALSSTII